MSGCPCYGCTHNVRCPKCSCPDVRLTWVAMYEWDSDSWACLDCGHCWAS
jgi:hypothetical protein